MSLGAEVGAATGYGWWNTSDPNSKPPPPESFQSIVPAGTSVSVLGLLSNWFEKQKQEYLTVPTWIKFSVVVGTIAVAAFVIQPYVTPYLKRNKGKR